MQGTNNHNDEHTHDHKEHEHAPHAGHTHGHGHSHGLVDASIIRSREGVKATSLAFLVLILTGLFQLVIYGIGNSVTLLADLIHNMGDALTAIPMAIAFLLRSKRGEKWAGYFVVFLIFVSACLVLFQVIERFINPQTPSHLWATLIAGVVGVLGNELAAVIRWRAGKRLNSPALIADGNHARTDGLVSLGVIISTIFIAIGFPIMDPIVGLVIAVMIIRVTWQSWKTIRAS